MAGDADDKNRIWFLPEGRFAADVREEISYLLEHGWVWQDERLTHPIWEEMWRSYDLATNQCTRSPRYAEIRANLQRLDDEAVQAAKEVRRQIRERHLHKWN
jgi:hypothetical protein